MSVPSHSANDARAGDAGRTMFAAEVPRETHHDRYPTGPNRPALHAVAGCAWVGAHRPVPIRGGAPSGDTAPGRPGCNQRSRLPFGSPRSTYQTPDRTAPSIASGATHRPGPRVPAGGPWPKCGRGGTFLTRTPMGGLACVPEPPPPIARTDRCREEPSTPSAKAPDPVHPEATARSGNRPD